MRQALTLGVRRLRGTKLVTTASALILAATLGALTASYALLDCVVLRPLPYPQSHELLWLGHDAPGLSFSGIAPPPGLQRHYAGEAETLSSLCSWSLRSQTLRGGRGPERIQTVAATSGLFTTLGTRPIAGRLFTAADDLPSSADVALVGEAFARSRFGDTKAAVGASLTMDGAVYTIVGVLPREFAFPDPPFGPSQARIWVDADLPEGATTFGTFGGSETIARRRSDASRAQVRADMNRRIAALNERVSPQEREVIERAGLTASPVPLARRVLGTSPRTPWLLFAGLASLFVVATFNLLQLALARRRRRADEEAVRGLFGAGTFDRFRRSLAEYALFVAPATLLAASVAQVLLSVFLKLGAGQLPRLYEVALDARHFAALAAVGVCVSVLLALGTSVGRPALQLARGAQGLGLARPRARRVLLWAQLTLLSLVLVATGVFGVGLRRLLAVDTGFDTAGLYRFTIELTESAYPQPTAVRSLHAALLSLLERTTGVEGICASTALPLEGSTGGTVLVAPSATHGDLPPLVSSIAESPGCAALFGGESTRELSADQIRVSSSLARAYWSQGGAVGRRVRIGTDEDAPLKTIAGLWRGRPADLLDLQPPVFLESLDGVSPGRLRTLHYALSAPSRSDALALVRERASEIDESIAVLDFAPFKTLIERRTAGTRLPSLILRITSILAVAVCALGLFAITSHATATRARELAVRAAVGASPAALLRKVLAETVSIAVLAAAAGAALAAQGQRVLLALLPLGASPLVPVVTTVALCLVALALIAAWLPAIGAARRPPGEVLRQP
ncbi:MAG: ABC transporter permease [Acidobacteriota bacterium]